MIKLFGNIRLDILGKILDKNDMILNLDVDRRTHDDTFSQIITLVT